ncbi:hypothetical protein DFH06DRAFT_1487096 [Mycena polygramma]|nr:hypothetical protein DFH06DRAFT_1487096 [Mycena polygramma]
MPALVLDQLLGMLLLGSWLASLLCGVVLVEAIKYFDLFPNDSWRRKGLVIIVLTLCVAAMVGELGNTYLPTVTYYGDFAGLTTMFWTFPLVSFTSALISSIVDCYLIYRFYTLCVTPGLRRALTLNGSIGRSKNIWATLFLYALMLLAVGGYLVIFVLLPTGSIAHRHTLTLGIIINFSAQAAVDVLIAAGLIWKLRTMKSTDQHTNTFLRRLMIGAVRTGTPTALCAILALATYLRMPNSEVSTFFMFQFAPLYTLTLLSNFNVRRHGRAPSSTMQTTDSWTAPGNLNAAEELHVHPTTMATVTTDSDDLDKKPRPYRHSV